VELDCSTGTFGGGGTLMGVKTDDIAVLERGKGDFFLLV
jgi:hypothetical protein